MASLQVVNIAVFLIISEQKLFLILLMVDVYTPQLINCRVLTGNCYRRVNWRKDDDQYDVFQVATSKNIYLHSQVLYKQIEIQSSEDFFICIIKCVLYLTLLHIVLILCTDEVGLY